MSAINTTEMNCTTRVFSPLTLRQDWCAAGRLLFMLFCSAYGSLMNAFLISSFFIEKSMRSKASIIFLVCAGACDFAITGIISPVVTVLIVSRYCSWDNLLLCKLMNFVGQVATAGYLIYHLFAGAENFYRNCRPSSKLNDLFRVYVKSISFLIIAGCILLGFVGTYYNLDLDYCERKHNGNFSWRIATTVIMQLIPSILTITFHLFAFNKIKLHAKTSLQYRRLLFKEDYASTVVNMAAFVIYLLLWTPYSIIVYRFPDVSDDLFYFLIVLGLLRSVITSSLYGLFHVTFQKTFGHLFKYFFLKVAINKEPVIRHQRRFKQKNEMAFVKVDLTRRVITRSQPRLDRIAEETYL